MQNLTLTNRQASCVFSEALVVYTTEHLEFTEQYLEYFLFLHFNFQPVYLPHSTTTESSMFFFC